MSISIKIGADNTLIQLLKYTIVGGTAFLIDISILIALTEILNLHYLISAAISFTIGLLYNYFLSTIWVFRYRKYQNILFELFLFGIIGTIGLGINEVVLFYFTEILQLPNYIYSKLISTFIVYIWNFFARKYLLFNKKAF